MGVYAFSPKSYETFGLLFKKIIDSTHNLNWDQGVGAKIELRTASDWDYETYARSFIPF